MNTLTKVELGKLLPQYDLNEIWEKEEMNFTPWLYENLDLLSEALGVSLEPLGKEVKVGAYELDIKARDRDSGATVVIENQLDETDHIHLGQLLTYAAGLDAKTIVWVAGKTRPEKKAAVEWLNKVTKDELSFFLVRIEVVKVDDSPPAVRFVVESAPSDFEQFFGAAKPKTPTIAPESIRWQGSHDELVPVNSWKEILSKTVELAIQEKYDIALLPIKATTNLTEAEEKFFSAKKISDSPWYIESSYSAYDTRRKVSGVLSALGKPAGFLKINCSEGRVFELPPPDSHQ